MFETAVNRTIGFEAGYVNDPQDPGGETKWGICKRDHPDLDIKNLARDAAVRLYQVEKWEPMPAAIRAVPALAVEAFDSSVHHGLGNTVRFVQTALGVAPDGNFGPLSAAALAAQPAVAVVLRFLAQRLRFMTLLSKFDTYGRGWSRRVAGCIEYAATDFNAGVPV